MFMYQPMPTTVHAIEEIIRTLQAESVVKAVTVSTLGGLPLTPATTTTAQIAAAAGFLFASANQTSALLSCQPGATITLETEDDNFIVCQPFPIGSVHLLLTVIFYRPFAYKRLFSRTIKAICHTLEA